MKKSYLIIGLIIVVGAIILFSGGNDETANVVDNMEVGEGMVDDGAMIEGIIITYTDEGFAPATLTAKKGDKVTWKNNSSIQIWPATAVHPTHTVYPGSGIEKCGTPDELMIFDACRNIAPGSSYSFTFNEVGTWNYHDHLNISLGKFGSVVVEE